MTPETLATELRKRLLLADSTAANRRDVGMPMSYEYEAGKAEGFRQALALVERPEECTMAKGQIKKIPFDTEAKSAGAGVWLWEVEGIQWRYEEKMGLNLSIVLEDDNLMPVVYVPDLKAAGYFTQGVAAGRNMTKSKK